MIIRSCRTWPILVEVCHISSSSFKLLAIAKFDFRMHGLLCLKSSQRLNIMMNIRWYGIYELEDLIPVNPSSFFRKFPFVDMLTWCFILTILLAIYDNAIEESPIFDSLNNCLKMSFAIWFIYSIDFFQSTILISSRIIWNYKS